MKVFDRQLIASLSERAKRNSRLRQNLNLHDSYDEPSQRLLNAMEPGSYIRPHRHLADPKPESFVGIRGRVALLIFGTNGEIEKVIPFGPGEDASGVDLPPGIWHTVVCLEKDSVFFETKPGPFNPIREADMAPWAPGEGSARAAGYLKELVSAARTLGVDGGSRK